MLRGKFSTFNLAALIVPGIYQFRMNYRKLF